MKVTSHLPSISGDDTVELRGAGPSATRYDFRTDPVLRAALDYWRMKRGVRVMPQRRDIEPAELREVLAHLQITEVIGGGSRFRYRLVGTAIVQAFGAESPANMSTSWSRASVTASSMPATARSALRSARPSCAANTSPPGTSISPPTACCCRCRRMARR
jgi:hypothetical protein